jgi:hypothetical protein
MADRVTKVFLAVLISGLTLGSYAATVSVRGVSSCGGWIEDRSKAGVGTLINESWLVGFLSGVAFESERDFVKGTDNASLFLWMDNYCRANPLSDVASGGYKLFQELAKQKGK